MEFRQIRYIVTSLKTENWRPPKLCRKNRTFYSPFKPKRKLGVSVYCIEQWCYVVNLFALKSIVKFAKSSLTYITVFYNDNKYCSSICYIVKIKLVFRKDSPK